MKVSHAVAGTLIGIFICNTTIFQRVVFPDAYWAKELANLEDTVQFVEGEMRISEARFEIEYAQILSDVLQGLKNDIAEAKQHVR